MRTRLLIVMGFLLLVWVIPKASKLSFTITPQLTKATPSLNVALSAKADRDGIINLKYLDKVWGEANLFDCIQHMTISDPDAIITKLPKENIIQIITNPSSSVRISYDIVQDFSGAENVQNYYRPIINKDYFHLFGHRIYMIPDYYFVSDRTEEIEIIWGDNNLVTQHSFGVENSETFLITQEELLESIAVGGDFRRLNIKLDGMDVFFLTRGEWINFSDQDLENTLKNIIHHQRAFWDDYDDDIYTITLLPFENEDTAYIGGTGLSKGFASYCSNSRSSEIKNITNLYSHEMMHHWIGGKIRNETLTGELWFSEGFTDYLSHLLLTQYGKISFNEYVNQLNKRIEMLKINPYHSVSNNSLNIESFSQFSDLESIAYLRGEYYALYLDQRLYEAYDGNMRLKDLLQIILEDAIDNNVRFSNQYFMELLEKFLGNEEVKAFNNYILKGNIIPADEIKGDLIKVKFGKVLPKREILVPFNNTFAQHLSSI